MGVPAFFRWLTEKYPKVVQDVLEARVGVDPAGSGTLLPFDSTLPNPSGLECDNFYIDMNGIIHPCSHPENGPQPSSEIEMYENVCRYIDRLFRAARPRKLLYLAIDGVAPRAKMNQQRARRFRSAQEVREKHEIEDKVRSHMKDHGFDLPGENSRKKKPWDSNVITPGTPFMKNLSDYVRFYIRKKMSEDKAWKQIKVIFSDASVPGEGEHKIMAHIRLQRTQPNYNPNLVHILHGLDADLIMLALATHEAHFYILREEVVFGRRNAEMNEQRKEQSGFKSEQLALDEEVGVVAMAHTENRHKPLVRLSIPILKEYLFNEFKSCQNVPFPEVSFEHVIDDIVFLCFFVGNDFLPHLPSLDIRDGGLDFLFNVYKKVLPTLDGYITDHGGKVNLSNVDVILSEVGAIEDHVFAMRNEMEKKNQEFRELAKERAKLKRQGKTDDPGQVAEGTNVQSIPQIRGRAAKILEKRSAKQSETPADDKFVTLGRNNSSKEINRNKRKMTVLENAKAAEELKKRLMGGGTSTKDTEDEEEKSKEEKKEDEQTPEPSEVEPSEVEPSEIDDDTEAELFGDLDTDGGGEKDGEKTDKVFKERVKELERQQLDNYAKNVEDKVRLHEKGWKDRYYKDKCKAENISGGGGREHLFRSYVKGLCWVMKYYYAGVPCWKWYFPFHYAPFASDLKNIERFQADCEDMDIATPFSPVEQLLSVLPEDSAHAVPKASRWLMSDPESPIIDFYPKDVLCDPNGKAMPWLWVVLLPFIEEDRLLDALKPTMKDWTEYEHFCNTRGLDDGYIFIHKSNTLFATLQKAISYPDKKAKHRFPAQNEFSGMVRPPLSHEDYDLEEQIDPPPGYAQSSRQAIFDEPIYGNECLCAAFSEPKKLPHRSILLPYAIVNEPILSGNDFYIRRPRLNRGGQTIANLGGGRKNQHGGGMHVSREVRNHFQGQLPTGMRQWGTQEPTMKRPRYGNNQNLNNGQIQQPQQQHYQQPYRPNLFGQNKNNYNNKSNNNNNNPRYNANNNNRHQNNFNFTNNNQPRGAHTRFASPPPLPPPHHHAFPPPPLHNPNFPPPPPHPSQGNYLNWTQQQQQQNTNVPPPSNPPNTNFSFNRGNNSYNNNNNSNNNNQNKRSGVNPALMQTLRSQLASTLKQNRQSGKRN